MLNSVDREKGRLVCCLKFKSIDPVNFAMYSILASTVTCRGGAGSGGAWRARCDGADARPSARGVGGRGQCRLWRASATRRCRRARRRGWYIYMEHQNSSFGEEGALLLFTSATSMAAWLGGAERGTGRGRCYRNKLEKKETMLIARPR